MIFQNIHESNAIIYHLLLRNKLQPRFILHKTPLNKPAILFIKGFYKTAVIISENYDPELKSRQIFHFLELNVGH